MAKDFLQLSRSYVSAIMNYRGGNGMEILGRREIIVKHANDDYTFSKAAVDDALAAVDAAGIKISSFTLKKDIEHYRIAYVYFHNGRETIEKRMEKNDWVTNALKYLLADGFDCWEKIEAALAQPVEAPLIGASEVPNAVSGASSEDFVLETPLEMMRSIFKSLPDEETLLKEDDFDILSDSFEKIRSMVYKRSVEILTLKDDLQENRRFLCEKDALIDELRQDLESSEQLMLIAEEEADELREQLNSTRSELKKLEEVRDILALIKDCTRNEVTPSVDPEIEPLSLEEELSEGTVLPEFCAYLNKPFIFSKKAVSFYDCLTDKEKRVVARAFENFSSVGPLYNGLYTKKAQRVNNGLMSSRAGRGFRFGWRDTAEGVIVDFIRRREGMKIS